MYGRLDPGRMYPAGVQGVATRRLTLATGITIRLAEAGPRAAPPVVLLHGWGGSVYMFRAGIGRLAREGFRVLAPDLRGFGISDKPTAPGAYTLDAYIADLVALLDACSLKSAALVGHSMGGGVALHAALRHADRVTALALVNPVGLAPIPGIALRTLVPRWSMDLLGRRAVPRWVVEFILRHIAYSRPELVSDRDVDEYWAPSQFDGYAHALRATLGEFDWPPVSEDHLRSLRMPTAVVLGAADRLVPPAASASAARAAGGFQLTVLPGGHCVHEEVPDLAYPAIAGAFA